MRADRPTLRILPALAALCLLAAATPPPSPAPPSGGLTDGTIEHDDEGAITIGVGAGSPGTDGTPGTDPAPNDDEPEVPMTEVTLRSIGSDDGVPCTVTETRWVPEDEAAELQTLNSTLYFLAYDRITADGMDLEPCPEGTPGIDPTPAFDFADEITEQLPRPELRLAPDNRAITGNTAYLQTGRPLTYGPVTRRLDLGPYPADVTITGTATFTVAWGDHPDGPEVTDGTVYSWAGGPFPGTGPDGAVSHTWADTGSYEVRVIDTWVVTIDIEGWDPLTQEAELAAVPLRIDVAEVRSVRDR